jgi:hypothetical protein
LFPLVLAHNPRLARAGKLPLRKEPLKSLHIVIREGRRLYYKLNRERAAEVKTRGAADLNLQEAP